MPAKLTQEEFENKVLISDPENKHKFLNNKYLGNDKHLTAMCEVHGEFKITPNNFYKGKRCKLCANKYNGFNKRKTQEEYMKQLLKLNSPLDFSKTVYKTSLDKVVATCKIHGDFKVAPNSLLHGHGCEKCIRVVDTLSYIAEAKSIYGNLYDYSKTVYTSSRSDVEVICKDHGVFSVMASSHISIKRTGCPSCSSYGFKTNKRGALYVITSGNITKVGITNRDLKKRIEEFNRRTSHTFEVLKYYNDNGNVVSNVETLILRELRKLYKQPETVFDGSTECFLDVDKEHLINRIEELIKGNTK